MTLSKESTNAEACMVEMAEKVRKGLGPIDPYFNKLADGMLAWIACWQMMNKKE
jgi:reversibly glycosylated polypeptide/UDP-arabinopyranose mutase